MGLNLRGLGHIATGMMKGYKYGMDLDAAKQENGYRKMLIDEQRRKLEQEAADREALGTYASEISGLGDKLRESYAQKPQAQAQADAAAADQAELARNATTPAAIEAASGNPDYGQRATVPEQMRGSPNWFIPDSFVPLENRRSYLDEKYRLQGEALTKYLRATRQVDKLHLVPEQMRKLRDGEFEERTRYALAQAAAGEKGAMPELAKVYQLVEDGRAIKPDTGAWDAEAQTWRGVEIYDEKTGKLVETRDITQDNLYSWASKLSAADIAKANITRREAAEAERRKELAELTKPRDLSPGEVTARYNPVTGKQVTMLVNPRAPGDGKGDGKAAPDALNFMSGFDDEKALDNARKIVDGRIAEGGAPVSDAQRAASINQLVRAEQKAWEQASRQQFVMNSVDRELRAVARDPQRYAALYEKAVAGGMTPEILASLGHSDPRPRRQPSGAQQPPANQAATPPRAAGSPGAQAAAAPAQAAGATNGPLAQLFGTIRGLGENFQTPEYKQKLLTRIREANSGGRPLDRVESLRARQLKLLTN